MGSGGDLNSKKSWHPLRAANIHATQKAEAEAIAERKKVAARIEEIKEDRKREELQKALEAAGGKVKPFDSKLAWMYSGPTDSNGGDAAESEAYLLGKRRIDKLLQDDTSKLQKQASQDSLVAAQPGVPSARDMAAKIRADPMLAMKKAQQEAYEAALKDPLERRKILAKMGVTEEPKSKEKRHHRHREHRHRSSRRERSESRDRDSRDHRRSSHRERSGSRDRGRREREDRDRRDRDRSRSPHDRSRRRRDSEGETPRRYRERDYGRDDNERADERARKLMAMQSAASDLEMDRDRRLAAIEEADRAAQDKDTRERERASKWGGDRAFTADLYRKAADR